jgi:hypothetical protein
MPLPLVFRRIAQVELDESVLWYENKRVGLGRQFRIEIEKHLERIADQPPNSSGRFVDKCVESFCNVFPIHYISCPKSTG